MPDLRELLMGAITVGVVGLATGCGGGSGQTPTTPKRTAPVVQPAPVSAGTQLYDGQAFAIAYPGGWWVHNAEQPRSFGTATTILDPADHARSVRIDVRAHAPSSAWAQARAVIGRLRRDPTYRQLDLRPLSYEGHAALHWEYVVDQGGRAVHKEVLFFADDGGRGVTIVTQAPQHDYAAWAEPFAATRGSYLPY